jgi:hypothetical protein
MVLVNFHQEFQYVSEEGLIFGRILKTFENAGQYQSLKSANSCDGDFFCSGKIGRAGEVACTCMQIAVFCTAWRFIYLHGSKVQKALAWNPQSVFSPSSFSLPHVHNSGHAGRLTVEKLNFAGM